MRNEKLKIALVSLSGKEHISQNKENVFNDTEPLGLLYIGGIAKQEGHEVKIFHSHQKANSSEEEIVKRIIEYSPEILGVSSMTNTFNRSIKLIEKVKSKLPNTKIIFGGDHIGTNPSDILNYSAIDIGVYGEGEETFREILKGYENKNISLRDIKGISFLENGKLVLNPPRKRVIDRTKLPLPLRDSEILKYSKVGTLMYPPMSDQTGAASLLFQFGCPFGCTYCSATTLYGKQVTKSDADFVINELKELKKNFGINTAFFTDLTFNLNSKLSEELCFKLEKANLGISWYALIRPTNAENKSIIKESTIKTMINAGCTKIGFGIESFEENAMTDYHRQTSLDEDCKTLRIIDKLGALTKVFLIMGHPQETIKYYDKIIENLKWLCPDEVRISFLTPFPGTEFWKNLNNKSEKLLTTNYDNYTTFKPVIKMNYLSPEELIKQKARILKEYYSSKEFKEHVKQKVLANPRFEKSYEEFVGILKDKNII